MPLEFAAVKEAVEGIIAPLGKTIDSLHTSREEKDELKIQLETMRENMGVQFNQLQASVIIAEAQGESWLQKNWRPLTMVSFVFIVVWNFVIGPIGSWLAEILGSAARFPVLELPVGLWATIDLGIGGYMTLRTVEKVKLGRETRKLSRKQRKALKRGTNGNGEEGQG
jgi:hypothetical protein